MVTDGQKTGATTCLSTQWKTKWRLYQTDTGNKYICSYFVKKVFPSLLHLVYKVWKMIQARDVCIPWAQMTNRMWRYPPDGPGTGGSLGHLLLIQSQSNHQMHCLYPMSGRRGVNVCRMVRRDVFTLPGMFSAGHKLLGLPTALWPGVYTSVCEQEGPRKGGREERETTVQRCVSKVTLEIGEKS